MPRDPAGWLYTPVAPSIKRFLRKQEKDTARGKLDSIRKALDAMDAILKDPKASESEKLLARIELVAHGYKWIGDDE